MRKRNAFANNLAQSAQRRSDISEALGLVCSDAGSSASGVKSVSRVRSTAWWFRRTHAPGQSLGVDDNVRRHAAWIRTSEARFPSSKGFTLE